MPDKQLHFYIDSDWDFKPPVVRIWVDDYLITERAVSPKRRDDEYLEEIVIIDFKKGKHIILVENVKTALANINLIKIIMDDIGDVHGENSVECPFTTKDNITYEAKVVI